ncbi:hypothetical protein [Chryseobacterium sp. ERMR1:04]|uniref:hypothetical protein n=1 Tax=Chryseobacterium sp. ERMR1:04 TaxID=1705393 RepID=UPI000A8A3411|nr:hypothetical protein [Chryseobacterium sp. ERMR1:04]
MNTEEQNNIPPSEPESSAPNTDPSEDEIMSSIIFTNEDEIIQYIKDKATKETMKSLAPLLEKLEEAVKQQQQISPPQSSIVNPTMVNYEEQLKSLQEISKEKIKAKELKVAERFNKLQIRMGNMRK